MVKTKCWSRRRNNGSLYIVCNESKGQKKTKKIINKPKSKKIINKPKSKKIINKPKPDYSKVKSKYQQKSKSKK